MKNRKGTLINMSAALITFAVQMFISFWLSPFVVARLGEEAYGFINLANNFVSYTGLLAVAINSMACRYISVKYNSGEIEEAKRYFSSVFIVNCLLYSLILIIAVIFVGQIERILSVTQELVYQVKVTFFLSFVNMGASLIGTVYTAATFTTNKMHYASLVQMASNILKSILVFILFTILPAKIYYLSIATLAASVVTLIGNYRITRTLLEDFSVKISLFDISKIIILVKSGVWVLLSNISNLLLNGFDLLLSYWFISSSIMGRLSIAKQIPFALSGALGIFSNIFSSSLTKVYVLDGKNDLGKEAESQLKLLTVFFTVPFAGIIAIGPQFLKLWLANTNYSEAVLNQIYILMLLVLIDIIISTYMYSIHSVFIALNKVKSYSILLFAASLISMLTTVYLLNYTNLGVYAIAGTSTIVLGVTHALIVPGIAALLLGKKISTFWIREIKSWLLLCLIVLIFKGISWTMRFDSWTIFCVNVLILATIGYFISFFGVFNNTERHAMRDLIMKKRKSNEF